MREIGYHPKVPAEARAFLKYYEEISDKLGDAFWTELMEAIGYARDHPERHHFDRTGRRRSNLRRFPVHFLFRVFPDMIRITAVRHDKQSPSYGVKRQ